MTTQTITPESHEHWLELRSQDITSTDVSALFGISPYCTLFELWHRKSNNLVVEFNANERMEWGNLLEPIIAQKIAEQEGWKVSPLKNYMRIPELRMGSSFDFSIDDEKPGIIEIKNVDRLIFTNKWMKKEDGNYEAPLHIEIQVQYQLLVSGRQYAYIGVLVGGNELILIKRTRDEKVINAIIEKVKWFWQTVDAKKEPEPDFAKDSKTIIRLYGYAEPDKVMEAQDDKTLWDMAQEYRNINSQIKDLDAACDEIKSKMLMIIGDAEKVLGNGFTISAGMISECPISYVRKAYRTFKINWKKGALNDPKNS